MIEGVGGSFEVMRARRLREALAFDNDFTVAGFIALRLEGSAAAAMTSPSAGV